MTAVSLRGSAASRLRRPSAAPKAAVEDEELPPLGPVNPYPIWALRFWSGMGFPVWLRLLARNRGRVSVSRIPIVLVTTIMTLSVSLLSVVQQWKYGQRIAAAHVDRPLFVLGHFRSGTTLLHELLALDQRFAAPTYVECFGPSVFLVMRPIIRRLSFLMPSRRPMDNMTLTLDSPSEDEPALFSMGLPSPLLTIAFPNEPPQDTEYWDLESVKGVARDEWKRAVTSFFKAVSYAAPRRRLVLKSPTHTGRIRVLLEAFPDAQFVHIARDPHDVYPSTVKLWRSLYPAQGVQRPTYEGLREYVFKTFEHMYEAYDGQRGLIQPGSLHEMRYEDLVHDPLVAMRALYSDLHLGDFEAVAPRLAAYFAERRDYRADSYVSPPGLAREIDARWGPHMARFGYQARTASTQELELTPVNVERVRRAGA